MYACTAEMLASCLRGPENCVVEATLGQVKCTDKAAGIQWELPTETRQAVARPCMQPEELGKLKLKFFVCVEVRAEVPRYISEVEIFH